MAKTLVYEMYPLSFDNIKRMEEHLYDIQDLGIDYIWLCPMYPSPRYDHGYDVSNYMAIDERFGTMEDFDHFIKTAHDLGFKVLMDLVLNHTSTEHEWFKTKPEYYCWRDSDLPGWQNLFDDGSCWKYDEEREKYYLHLFHEKQADLNWFPDGLLNWSLVKEFREIVNYWVDWHDVDSFRIDVPQTINKDFTKENLNFGDMLFGKGSIEVINEIFKGMTNMPFLIMECFDPTYGDIIDLYANNTHVDFIMNVQLKSSMRLGKEQFEENLKKSTKNRRLMLDLESHDSPRFLSYGVSVEEEFSYLFDSGAEAICIYQGQELGLKNPNHHALTDDEMIALDAETAMRVARGEDINALRPYSRANGRIKLPANEYWCQDEFPHSDLHLFAMKVREWKYKVRGY